MSHAAPAPNLFVIFGGAGDLARRKLLPALCRLASSGRLHSSSHVVGIGRKSDLNDESYRALAREALARVGFSTSEIAAFAGQRLHYHAIGAGSAGDYEALSDRLHAIEKHEGLPGNRAFYLALPPGAFVPTIAGLGAAGLNESPGYTRLVVEKPFGTDLASAVVLNNAVHEHFSEAQIYRIDHYLGKETVQNLLVLRFANTIFESLWNRDRIGAVQITHAESLGVGTRAGYYDRSGAMRDMIQNHLTQLLSLVAMEIPASYDADAIRYEKIKVLRSIRPLDPANVIRGQYSAGTSAGAPVRGYLEEDGVPDSSHTETFVAMQVAIDNWRWSGVPFYLRTGKRMGGRLSQIAVRFRDTPTSLFDSMGCDHETADVLVITLQPEPGFSMHFDIKVPGTPLRMHRIPLGFRYSELFDAMPEAYETLLLDVMNGDQTLFVHGDEVEQSWKLYTPLLINPPPVYRYPAGTWGPSEAEHLAIAEKDLWTGGAA